MTLTTRSAGSFVSVILKRKGALPRAVRESRDYDSAVRVRILTPRLWSRDYKVCGAKVKHRTLQLTNQNPRKLVHEFPGVSLFHFSLITLPGPQAGQLVSLHPAIILGITRVFRYNTGIKKHSVNPQPPGQDPG